ncbi:unnamed protein product, partial [Ectocarpus fasciculatus]
GANSNLVLEVKRKSAPTFSCTSLAICYAQSELYVIVVCVFDAREALRLTRLHGVSGGGAGGGKRNYFWTSDTRCRLIYFQGDDVDYGRLSIVEGRCRRDSSKTRNPPRYCNVVLFFSSFFVRKSFVFLVIHGRSSTKAFPVAHDGV